MTINEPHSCRPPDPGHSICRTQNYKLPAMVRAWWCPPALVTCPPSPRDDNIISGQCPPRLLSRDQNTATNGTNFIIHSTSILDKEDQRIVIFPHVAPNLRYFFSVSKSNNMKGNAAETFIKPTIRIRRLNVNLIVYWKKWKSPKHKNSRYIITILDLSNTYFKNQFQNIWDCYLKF